MFFCCLQQLPLQERAHLLPVASEISLLFLPLIRSATLTLYAPRPSVLFHTSFCHVSLSTLLVLCVSIATGKAQPRPGVSGGGLFLWFLGFLFCYFTSPFAFCAFYLCPLQFSSQHHSKPTPLEGIEAWSDDGLLFTFEALSFWFSNAVLTISFNIFLLLLDSSLLPLFSYRYFSSNLSRHLKIIFSMYEVGFSLQIFMWLYVFKPLNLLITLESWLGSFQAMNFCLTLKALMLWPLVILQ